MSNVVLVSLALAWSLMALLMPAFPAMFVLMAAGIPAACKKLPLPVQAQAQSIFKQYDFEQRYVKAAAYVSQLRTSNAMILAVQHGGSVRYYANRVTLRYDFVAPDGLDAVLRELITP